MNGDGRRYLELDVLAKRRLTLITTDQPEEDNNTTGRYQRLNNVNDESPSDTTP